MKKVIFWGLIYLTGFIGILANVGFFIFYSNSYGSYEFVSFSNYLRDTGTTFMFILSCTFAIVGLIKSYNEMKR